MTSGVPKQTIALFNYGGGIRGLIPAHLMARIEDTTGLRMAEMVDIFTGPSTGAILNAAMTLRHPEEPSQPKYRARHMVRFYEREGVNIFPADSLREFRGLLHDMNNRTVKLSRINNLLKHGHYDPGHLGAALRALFGDIKLKDSLRSLIIPVYNIDSFQDESPEERAVDRGGHAVWLKNIRTQWPAGIDSRTPDVRLYDAVMASCAAPTYFPCHHFTARYPGRDRAVNFSAIDGCIFDNPCISYMGAIRPHVPPDHNLTMVVLGTGDVNKSIRKEDWNRYGALGVVDPANDLPLINIFFNAPESALTDTYQSELKDNLFTFNKSLHGDINKLPSSHIDDGSPENLKRLRFFVEAILEDNAKRFDELCHVLVSNRDRKTEENAEKTKKARARKFFTLFAGDDDTERLED